MMPADRTALRIASLLLDYPGDEVLADLGSTERDLASCPAAARDALAPLLRHLRSTPALCIQEEYAATFDFDAACSLNLAWQRFGDAPERVPAMASLIRAYSRAGYRPIESELPDYAPLMLQFLAVCPDETVAAVTGGYAGALSKLAGELEKKASPYADLIAWIAGMFERKCEGG